MQINKDALVKIKCRDGSSYSILALHNTKFYEDYFQKLTLTDETCTITQKEVRQQIEKSMEFMIGNAREKYVITKQNWASNKQKHQENSQITNDQPYNLYQLVPIAWWKSPLKKIWEQDHRQFKDGLTGLARLTQNVLLIQNMANDQKIKSFINKQGRQEDKKRSQNPTKYQIKIYTMLKTIVDQPLMMKHSNNPVRFYQQLSQKFLQIDQNKELDSKKIHDFTNEMFDLNSYTPRKYYELKNQSYEQIYDEQYQSQETLKKKQKKQSRQWRQNKFKKPNQKDKIISQKFQQNNKQHLISQISTTQSLTNQARMDVEHQNAQNLDKTQELRQHQNWLHKKKQSYLKTQSMQIQEIQPNEEDLFTKILEDKSW